jgi:hypothetical protein
MTANHRRAKRQPASVDGMIYDENGQSQVGCVVRNVSATGAQLELAEELELPQSFLLSLSRDGAVGRRCSKVWQFSTVVGVRFRPTE